MARTKQVSARKRPARKALKKVLSKAPKKPVNTRKRYRLKPGSKLISILISINANIYLAKALQEIRRYQKSTELLIPKAPFIRLVREIIVDITGPGRNFRIQALAISALQEAAESTLVTEFECKLFYYPVYTNIYTNLRFL